MVFVDAAHPIEMMEQKKRNRPSALTLMNGLKAIEKLFDEFKFSEAECIETTVNQINSAGDFPDIPIAVVSGTKKMLFAPKQAFDLHQQCQLRLLELSAHSQHYLCSESDHFPQITEPEIVVDAVATTIESAEVR